ncbi:MAG: hypothetical protein ABI806_10060 [Candidatus Solibacter sp.]
MNSKSATVLLKTLPLSIGFTPSDSFAIIDQRHGGKILYTPSGTDPSTVYGLLTVLTGADSSGKKRRTLELTGTGTASALQGAVEFFCSASSMRELRARMGGFPPNYQVVIRCTASGLRLISYHYETHVIVEKPLELGQ